MKGGLTKQEREALTKFAEGLRGLFALPMCHVADGGEMAFHVHAIQSIVMARAAVRAYPDEFTHVPDFK